MWNFTECDESQSVGTAIELFQQEAVDVVIGPGKRGISPRFVGRSGETN